MSDTTIPDSVMRLEAVHAAVASIPDTGEETQDQFMARVLSIYAFLKSGSQPVERGTPH